MRMKVKIRMRMRMKMRMKMMMNLCFEIKQINSSFEKIDETKSFEDQINIFKKLPCLNGYWYIEYDEDNKEINYSNHQMVLPL